MKRSLLFRLMFSAFPLYIGEEGGGNPSNPSNPANPNGPGDPNNPNPNLQPKPEVVLNPFVAPTNNDPKPNQTSSGPDGSQNADPNKTVDDYIAGLDFSGGADVSAMMEAVTAGDSNAFSGELNKMLSQTYRQAMMDANRVSTNQMQTIRNESVRDASANMNFQQAVTRIQTDIPSLSHEAQSPIVKAALKGFMSQNDGDVEKSVSQTREYFKNMATAMAKDFKIGGSSESRPFSGNGPGAPNSDTPGNSEDWTKFLGPQF